MRGVKESGREREGWESGEMRELREVSGETSWGKMLDLGLKQS